MPLTRRAETALVILLALFVACTARADVMNLPMPTQYVVDRANVIDQSAENQINSLLHQLDRKTTAHVIVLTVPSLEGNPLEDVSLHLAHDVWKLGYEGKDNGVLVLVAIAEKRYRIEVGYGLEGVIPDSVTGTIGREYFMPYFRRGDYSGGISAAANEIARLIAADAGVSLTGGAAPSPPVTRSARPAPGDGSRLVNLLFLILLMAVPMSIPLIIFLLLMSGRRLGGRSVWWSGGSGGWGGGGGFGGGGFGGGGFGGGGGGGFGGGGASGGW
jgi:uncharacterized protein